MTLWEKAGELVRSPWNKIVTVGLVSGDHVLTGKRRDNGLWTSPGGHIEDNETLLEAARREVIEESGIDLAGVDLHLIRAERLVSHRSGIPFVVFAFIANVDKSKATGKDDPDKEVSVWRWVKVHADTPELKAEARHAKDDFVLAHLGVQSVNKEAKVGLAQDPRDKKRTMKEVSDDIQGDKNPVPPAGAPRQPAAETEEPSLPEPGKKTPKEMDEDPLNVEDSPF